MVVVGIALAGAVGAPARYLLDRFIGRRTRALFPIGIFVVNVSGSFVAGVIAGLALYHALPDSSRLVLATGFCGAFTTFSTFTFDSVALLEGRDYRPALGYVLLSSVVPTLAAGAGLALAAF